MSYQAILALAITLSKEGQLQLILSLSHLGHEETGALRSRCTALINKREPFPHLEWEALSSLRRDTRDTTIQVQGLQSDIYRIYSHLARWHTCFFVYNINS